MESTPVLLNEEPEGYATFYGLINFRLLGLDPIQGILTWDQRHQLDQMTNLSISERSRPQLIELAQEIGLKEISGEYSTWKIEYIPTIVVEYADIDFIGKTSSERIIYTDLTEIVLKLMDSDLTPDQVYEVLKHCTDHYQKL